MTTLLEKMCGMNEEMVNHFFECEIAKGHFSKNADPKEMSGFLLSVLFGLAVQARSGKTIEQFRRLQTIRLIRFQLWKQVVKKSA